MATKTPYEIRADLLVLAQRICYDRCAAEAAAEGDPAMSVSPTTEEIIAEAKKLNFFVSTSENGGPSRQR